MRRGFFFLLILILLQFPFPVLAQEKYDPDRDLYPNAYIANPEYAFMADSAMNYMPERFDFMQFRGVYTRTRQYDPIGDQSIEALQEAAFRMSEAKNAAMLERARAEYQLLITDHLANLGVVTQAHVLAKENPKLYGNPNFFAWMRRGLLNAVMNSREGLTLKDAYTVVTLPEETALLANLNVELLRSEPVKEGFTYYNMNEVKDLTTGKIWTVFVNTTFPMDFLERKEKLRARQYKLP